MPVWTVILNVRASDMDKIGEWSPMYTHWTRSHRMANYYELIYLCTFVFVLWTSVEPSPWRVQLLSRGLSWCMTRRLCRSSRLAPINMTISVSSFPIKPIEMNISDLRIHFTDFKTCTLPRITNVWITCLQLEVELLSEFLKKLTNITFQCGQIIPLYFT